MSVVEGQLELIRHLQWAILIKVSKSFTDHFHLINTVNLELFGKF